MAYKTAYQQYHDYLAAAGTLSFFEFQQKGLVKPDLLPPPGSMLKDSFWAEIKERWPGEFERFTAWVDDYKRKEDWDQMFPPTIIVGGKNGPLESQTIKFYRLPSAMQIGIFMQYCIEENHRYELLEGQPKSMGKLVDMVKEWFCEEHEEALRDHQAGKYMDDFDHNTE